jgi:hypothetical protein
VRVRKVEPPEVGGGAADERDKSLGAGATGLAVLGLAVLLGVEKLV